MSQLLQNVVNCCETNAFVKYSASFVSVSISWDGHGSTIVQILWTDKGLFCLYRLHH